MVAGSGDGGGFDRDRRHRAGEVARADKVSPVIKRCDIFPDRVQRMFRFRGSRSVTPSPPNKYCEPPVRTMPLSSYSSFRSTETNERDCHRFPWGAELTRISDRSRQSRSCSRIATSGSTKVMKLGPTSVDTEVIDTTDDRWKERVGRSSWNGREIKEGIRAAQDFVVVVGLLKDRRYAPGIDQLNV